MQHSKLIITAALAVLWGGAAHAAVSAEEAKALGTTLTPMGAEKAGNKDGSIPAYTGGEKPPASYKGGHTLPNPYAGEKPKAVITQANAAQYSDKLTAGAKELLKKFPDFRMDLYPTHRSAAFPQKVIDATMKNATQAKTKDGGVSIEGAWGGTPFPIPKDGAEVMWNHLTTYKGIGYTYKLAAYNVDAAGNVVQSNGGQGFVDFPYYGAPNAEVSKGVFFRLKTYTDAPARRNGEKLIVLDHLNPLETGRRAWQYLPGQRRTKLSPDVSYDTPQPGTAGTTTYDDTFIFNGAMDRFDWKLVGKKEMIVPYNMYSFIYEKDIPGKLAGPKFANPDYVRWELHRVWVVEATLKPGSRHIYAKRTFYIDEDTWAALASDSYDARGQLYRAGFSAPVAIYTDKGTFADTQFYYDFIAGTWVIGAHPGLGGGPKMLTELMPDREWGPDSLSGTGIR